MRVRLLIITISGNIGELIQAFANVILPPPSANPHPRPGFSAAKQTAFAYASSQSPVQ